MSKIIIGIHGMGNKPDAWQLEGWWKAALREGLEQKGCFWFLKFKLVYWASVLHPEPYSPDILEKKHPLFLKEPYTRGNPAVVPVKNGESRKRVRDQVNEQLDRIFLEKDGSLNFSGLSDFIMHHFVKDLDAYYRESISMDNRKNTRDIICGLLADTLWRHRKKKILIIAHSMGSIIAWDVLTRYVPDVKIHTLVTIGSPLGIPVIRSRMISEVRKETGVPVVLRTPENIRKAWYNLADFKDRVALNYDLKGDFLPNSLDVMPQDLLVWNNYSNGGERNPHKSYGYLRCPEMAEILSRFLRGR